MSLRLLARELGGELVKTKKLGGLGNKSYKLVLDTGKGLKSYSVKIYQGRDGARKARKEYSLYRLMPVYGLNAPKIVMADFDGRLLGRPLLAWEWIEGEAAEKFLGRKSATSVARLLGYSLALFHSIPPDAVGPELRGHVDRFWIKQVEWLKTVSRLVNLRLSLPQALLEELNGEKYVIIHGDYNPGNILVARDGIYIIDQESAELGDPVYDLAYCSLFIALDKGWDLVRALLLEYLKRVKVNLRHFSFKVALIAAKLYTFLSLRYFVDTIRWKMGALYPIANLVFLKPFKKRLLRIAREEGILM